VAQMHIQQLLSPRKTVKVGVNVDSACPLLTEIW
jgi:hypothetical protein